MKITIVVFVQVVFVHLNLTVKNTDTINFENITGSPA